MTGPRTLDYGKQNDYDIENPARAIGAFLTFGSSPPVHLYALFSDVAGVGSAVVDCAEGSGVFPRNIDWTTPRAFPLISFAIACLSSSNNRSKFSLFAAMYACSSLYKAWASVRFCSRYVGGIGELACKEEKISSIASAVKRAHLNVRKRNYCQTFCSM